MKIESPAVVIARNVEKAVSYWHNNHPSVKSLIIVDVLLFIGILALFFWFSPAQNG